MTQTQGIWNFTDMFPSVIQPQYQISLSEGHTPLEKYQNLYLKREDLNPTGSVKDRGLAFQISAAIQAGHTSFVISSSGNAAISAARYCHQAKCSLTVFISPKTDPGKLNELKKYTDKIETHYRPIWAAQQAAKQSGLFNLRSSRDEHGSIGYQTIAFELLQQLKTPIAALFLPVSSGTTLVGVAQGFKLSNQPLPQIHIVQTSAVNSLAQVYDQDFTPSSTSLAGGIVARFTPHKAAIHDLIKQTSGHGWIISDEEILAAHQQLSSSGITTGYESAAAVAAYQKALKSDWNFPQGNTVCLMTGSLRN